MKFREYLNEAKMTDKEFLSAFMDVVDAENIDYNKLSTRDIIGSVVVILGKDKKYKSMYAYWSKNRGPELQKKIEQLFD